MKRDYTLPDGTVIEVNAKKETIPDIDVSKMSEQELENHCVELFSKFGWDVRKEEIVKLEKGSFRADLVIGDGGRDYGFVEVVSSSTPEGMIKKKESIECIMDACKPDVCILTNGTVFDIFYKGEYTGTQEVPPTPEDLRRTNRLLAYAKAFKELRSEE
ncbi:hypothetical protein [Pseudobutyrivibrio ruminis]|uniref:Type I restriction enzyme R protein N-terminal domain-containing protein n=1 Tax=Pseudobutyrivibrio ruminis TaxID=46206 RepID=A0A2G3DWL2_9FIRM|nr:hypothetical protein [Pseudobutyrivibrio ruminis]PHU35384.1 hypothetical protein CSX01_05305 [Pseudobutyrivibrio ruminis]